jgi:hypothetical protein
VNNSSFLKQSTNISNLLVAQIKLVPPKIKPKEKLIRGPLNIIKKQENKNEMNKKNKQRINKTYKQHKEKKKKCHRLYDALPSS